jgi:hypothetical protein
MNHAVNKINATRRSATYFQDELFLHGAETWILWKIIRNTLKVLKCGVGEG